MVLKTALTFRAFFAAFAFFIFLAAFFKDAAAATSIPGFALQEIKRCNFFFGKKVFIGIHDRKITAKIIKINLLLESI